MEIIKTERIILSEEENKAFQLMYNCCNGIVRESSHSEYIKTAQKVVDAIVDFATDIIGKEWD